MKKVDVAELNNNKRTKEEIGFVKSKEKAEENIDNQPSGYHQTGSTNRSKRDLDIENKKTLSQEEEEEEDSVSEDEYPSKVTRKFWIRP